DMGSRQRRKATLAGVAMIVVILATLTCPATAGAEDLATAQQRANKAADELARVVEQRARADDTVANLETRVARVDARVASVRDQVRQLAIRQYVQGTSQITRLLRMADANEVVRAQQYASVVAETSTEALGQYRADKDDLRKEVAALEREQDARADVIGDLRRRQDEAMRELARLARVEEQARAAREEQQRRADAAAAAASAAAAPAARTAPTPAAADASPANGEPSPAPTAAPRPATPPSTTRAPAPAPTVTSADWICPVQGPRAFSNDYGAPRGGGSSHQGNDILAPTGTPVVANVGGVVTQRTGAISGLAYFLAGDDGNRYFGAHLDSFGASGRVTAGTVIGTVGKTGDASGGPPHLHFEIHPGGSGYTNPYPTLTKYC
ncbi:MAG TPA: peptidoglycan DD-metalloendopeptidase family protein, partial [Acidimicrobiales bacterium]|nr:peptidoglycan DD-metalloendopeptidase family protein [Acidimicrobiales bacterium]